MLKERVKQTKLYQRFSALYEKYERFLIPAFLVGGVVVDFITFKVINIRTAFTLIAIHTLLAGFSIAYWHLYDAHKIPRITPARWVRLAVPLILQFTFGALLGASLIFYWFSGSFSVSWPFIAVIAALMVSNEVLRDYFQRVTVQIGVYFFILFSISALILPYVFNAIGFVIFLLSGFVSVLAIWYYTSMLSFLLEDVRRSKGKIAIAVMALFGFMNFLYFTNIIPPIPLALREGGVYHQVESVGSDYHLQAERENIFQKMAPGQTIHVESGARVYTFTAIFAPADLDATIVHKWQYFDRKTRRWITTSEPSFRITGGRDAGYRGYSYSTNVRPGRWRVSVQTRRGQTLGRVHFRIVQVDSAPETIQVVR